MTEALKTCPCCQSSAIFTADPNRIGYGRVECVLCDMRTGGTLAEFEARRVWNLRRGSDTEAMEATDRVVEHLHVLATGGSDNYMIAAVGQLIDHLTVERRVGGKAVELHLANCCTCGRIVDTREARDGGDNFGDQMTDGRWTCSVRCYEEAIGERHRYCSFCGKDSLYVKYLMAGPDADICDECITIGVEIIGQHAQGGETLPDWQLAAFDATLRLAEERHMVGSGSLGFDHLKDMRARITVDFTPDKIGRWLGWAQCAVVASGEATMEEFKVLNETAKLVPDLLPDAGK